MREDQVVYEKKSPEKKRIIIQHLFTGITSKDDKVNLRFNEYVSVIAHNVRLTRNLTGGGK